jgi:hypothetical protein
LGLHSNTRQTVYPPNLRPMNSWKLDQTIQSIEESCTWNIRVVAWQSRKCRVRSGAVGIGLFGEYPNTRIRTRIHHFIDLFARATCKLEPHVCGTSDRSSAFYHSSGSSPEPCQRDATDHMLIYTRQSRREIMRMPSSPSKNEHQSLCTGMPASVNHNASKEESSDLARV